MWRIGQRRGWQLLSAALVVLCLSGCSGPQSALAPAGVDAERLADLFWYMLLATVLIWTAVIALALGAAAGLRIGPRAANHLVIWGGAVAPTVVVLVCLIYGLMLISDLRAGHGDAEIAVSGEQFWWRITYQLDDGRRIETANALHLPNGRRSQLALTTPDVIHSFWVPTLAGKLDMIPGYTNRLTLEPSQTGSFRGQCAELCGLSHAFMAFNVEVMEPAEFSAWLAAAAAPARAPETDAQKRGYDLFFSEGCSACHTIRGTPADGRVGPDLTHVASRPTLAAGMLETSPESFKRWIANAQAIKPGNRMPSYDVLEPGELDALAAYLGALE